MHLRLAGLLACALLAACARELEPAASAERPTEPPPASAPTPQASPAEPSCVRPRDHGCTAWDTGFGVVEIGEPTAEDGDAPVYGDREDPSRQSLRWRGKAIASFHGHGIFLHFARPLPDRAMAVVDHYVPGLHCRHLFHVVEFRADGTHVLSAPFGDCGLDGVEVAHDGDDLKITLDGQIDGEATSATYAWHDGKIELLAQVGVEDRAPPAKPMPVTMDGIGPIRLGMTIDEARRAMPDARFERTSDGDGAALVAVVRGDETLMVLWTGEDDADAPVDGRAQVWNIESFSPAATTPEGVAVGWRLDDAAKLFGPVVEIQASEIEQREYVKFRDQPAHLQIRIDYCGQFAEGERRTTRHAPDCRILALSIGA
jgi:hypothetical protein